MGKTRNTGKLATQIQFDNSNNLVIGNSVSSSFNTSGSVNATGGITGSIFGIGNPTSFSASISSNLGIINNFTASNGNTSLNSFSASNGNDSLNAATSSYSKLSGGNTFSGTQIISGSTYVQGDFVVYGSSSIQYISASSVSIGTNVVQLNTATPAVRYAGLSVQDSGSSAGVTGSIVWDSLCNRWMYSNPSTIGYSGGIIMSGPRAATLGTETTLTCNYIAKSGGGDHLYDSCIYESGSCVGINCSTPTYTLDVNGCGRFSNTLRIQHPSLWGVIELVGSADNQGGQVDFYGGTTRYATITGEQESTNNGELIYRTLKSNVLTTALTIASTGAATFSSTISAGVITGDSLSTGVPSIIAKVGAGGNNGTFGFGNSSDYRIRGGSDYAAMIFDTAGSERMHISNAGTFGFNCSGVAARTMVVKGATGCYIVAEFIEPAGVHSIELYPNKNCTNHISSDYMSGGVYLPLSLSGRECTTDLVLGINGNVGINNSNPLTMLQVSLTPNAVAKTRNTCFGSCGLVFLSGLQGTTNSEVGIFGGNDFGSLSAGIGMARANSGDWDTHLRFYTHIPSTSGNPADITEKMRITGNGDVLVGVTSSANANSARGLVAVNGSSTVMYELQVGGSEYGYVYHGGSNGNMYLNNARSNGSTYVITGGNGVYLSANATSWTANSDERLKNITGTIENAIESLQALRTVKHTWKSDNTNKEHLALIAQDVEQVFPQVIDKSKLPSKPKEEQTDETEYLGVRYTELIPVLVKAIQEQQCIICFQSQKIALLESCIGIV